MFIYVFRGFRGFFDSFGVREVFKNLPGARGFVLTEYEPIPSHGDPIRAQNYKCSCILDASRTLLWIPRPWGGQGVAGGGGGDPYIKKRRSREVPKRFIYKKWWFCMRLSAFSENRIQKGPPPKTTFFQSRCFVEAIRYFLSSRSFFGLPRPRFL